MPADARVRKRHLNYSDTTLMIGTNVDGAPIVVNVICQVCDPMDCDFLTRFLSWWFAFNPAGTEQSWFGGVGTNSGNTATITDEYRTIGGRWIPNFDPSRIVNSAWGTLTITFTDCNHGRVDFDSVARYGAGSMNLTRSTQPAGLSCP